MSLSFLVPAFLAGLLALAVPVLIHLTRRPTHESVPFPSLMFLQRISIRSDRRRRIHRWPLLLLRCLAVAALVLAFARPFLEERGAGVLPAVTGDREVVVLLDRSYSMGHGDAWQRAVGAARETLDGLGRQDRATLLLFDSRPEAVTESTLDHGLLRAALADARPGTRGTRYAPALQRAQRTLAASPLPRREVVVISDFQRAAWDADASEIAAIRFPAGTTVTPVPVAASQEGNVSVAGVTFDRSSVAGRERVGAAARLTHRGERAPAAVPVVLELDGRPVETRRVTLVAGGAITVEFDPFVLPASGWTRGAVRVPDDALAADNVFHFTLSADQRIPVLLVEGSGGGADAGYFLQRALAIGDAPGFHVEVRRAGELRTADLARGPVVILNGAPLPGGELGRQLRAHVEQGGGVVLVLGEGSSGSWEGVLPDGAARRVDHSARGGTTLGYVDLGHPVFEPFTQPRSGDFAAARVFQYRHVDAEGARVLARFGDGGVALAEHRVGSGRVLVWASGMDTRWNDLALQPVFLPFVHQLVKHGAGYTPRRPWLTVDEPFDPAAAAPLSTRYTTLLSPSGARTALEDAPVLTLDEPGFHELRQGEREAAAAVMAVNVDLAEAVLDAFDPRELVAALTAASDDAPAAALALTLTPTERERQQSAWWYLIVVAFLLLAAETVLSNRLRAAPASAAIPDPARRWGEGDGGGGSGGGRLR
jgi:hypothetical protein